MAMVFCTSFIFAQAKSKTEVPANGQAAFTAKYPVDSLQIRNGQTVEVPTFYNI